MRFFVTRSPEAPQGQEKCGKSVTSRAYREQPVPAAHHQQRFCLQALASTQQIPDRLPTSLAFCRARLLRLFESRLRSLQLPSLTHRLGSRLLNKRIGLQHLKQICSGTRVGKRSMSPPSFTIGPVPLGGILERYHIPLNSHKRRKQRLYIKPGDRKSIEGNVLETALPR